jgi:hypothetical protein
MLFFELSKISMSFDQILEELPKLTAEEKRQLRDLLDSELSWTPEEEDIIEEGIRSREEAPSLSWEALDERIREKHGF